MSDKQKQLSELLTKSCKFIVANLNGIEKEMYVFAIKGEKAKALNAAKTLKTIADVLKQYPDPGVNYEPRKYPASFTSKVDQKMLTLCGQIDALLAVIRGKIIPVIQTVKSGKFSARVSTDIVKINNVLKAYIKTLTTSNEASK